MDNNKEIIQAIMDVKAELSMLRHNKATKSEQLECFNRLITLYAALNLSDLVESKKVA